MNLRCSKILITGGGSGIGFAIAKRLITSGARIVIAGRTPEKLEMARAEIGSHNVGILPWDVSDIPICQNKILQAAKMMGGLDAVVNNAAVSSSSFGRGWEPWDITETEWDTVMNTTLKGAFFVMRNAVNYMLENNIHGNIVNISSNAAYVNITGPYGASKLALLKMTNTFGKRFGKHGIIIHGIAPGATTTPMTASYTRDAQTYPRHAIGRFIRPEEIAELAAFLLSESGEMMCGHTIIADGGDNNAHI